MHQHVLMLTQVWSDDRHQRPVREGRCGNHDKGCAGNAGPSVGGYGNLDVAFEAALGIEAASGSDGGPLCLECRPDMHVVAGLGQEPGIGQRHVAGAKDCNFHIMGSTGWRRAWGSSGQPVGARDRRRPAEVRRLTVACAVLAVSTLVSGLWADLACDALAKRGSDGLCASFTV